MKTELLEAVRCFHCGQHCDEVVTFDDKPFCCVGCKSVFEILNENNLCEYYQIDEHSGVSQKNTSISSYAFLDAPDIRAKVLAFDSSDFAKIEFRIPSIHCVSCIWLLENLRKLNNGVLKATVIFGKKTVEIDFDPKQTKLSELGALLASLGYSPLINLATENRHTLKLDKSLIYRLSVAGFCFGNVMLFSFPEYLGIDQQDENLKALFSWLNLLLSVPVFFFSASTYFSSALNSFKHKMINIDVPIAAGLVALFFRSAYDIITATGAGYLDSFTGLVFFLLIGRWFQGKTYQALSFDRDYKSYFPLSVNKFVNGDWSPIIIYELRKDDRIRIRNMEIVPADSILISEKAYFDYSFVTGEARPVKAVCGEKVYAGGKLVGEPVELTVEKVTSQSYLTSLWNSEVFRKVNESVTQKTIDRAARIFTWVVIALAMITAVFWYWYEPSEMWLVLTSVLMVACPCALALAMPFTYGSLLRVFGKYKFYLKNTDVIERMAAVNAVVFDKTGTIQDRSQDVKFRGDLSDDELASVKKLASCSTHPKSILITKAISKNTTGTVLDYKEWPGQGIEGKINEQSFRIGSIQFMGIDENDFKNSVFVSVNGIIRGHFEIKSSVRPRLKKMLSRLGKKCVALLSGDNEADKTPMKLLFGPAVQLLFNQTPQSKMQFVENLQYEGKKVMMIGDGLNDVGALKQSDVGIAVTDDSGVFNPACDGILDGTMLHQFDKFLLLAKQSAGVLKMAFAISFLYNAIALSFAISGHLTPLVAAILMPLSSISVVGFSTIAIHLLSKKEFGSWQ